MAHFSVAQATIIKWVWPTMLRGLLFSCNSSPVGHKLMDCYQSSILALVVPSLTVSALGVTQRNISLLQVAPLCSRVLT